jgi:hypothetical protein
VIEPNKIPNCRPSGQNPWSNNPFHIFNTIILEEPDRRVNKSGEIKVEILLTPLGNHR